MHELLHPQGFPRLWPWVNLLFPWTWFPHARNGGMGRWFGSDGGFPSPILVLCELLRLVTGIYSSVLTLTF